MSMLTAATPALAEFEGVMEMKLTMASAEGRQGGGTVKLAVSKTGARSQMEMQMPQMSMKMDVLFKNATPDVLYHINDAARTYSEIDLAQMRQMAGSAQKEEKLTVTKLGEEKILGYKTQHVLVTGKDSSTNELWIAKDLIDYDTFAKLQARSGGSGRLDALNKALKDAGAEGMPLKMISTSPDGVTTTIEVVKAEKQSLPALTFEIPAGYTKSAGGMMDMMGGMSGPQVDDAKKKMDEALKNMTPEQREMFQKMMKQHGAGKQ